MGGWETLLLFSPSAKKGRAPEAPGSERNLGIYRQNQLKS